MDRAHVIGHNQVPDPNNPKLFGGSDHHWDPGPYWNWKGYLVLANNYANALPSPPHMVLQATAFSGDGTATVRWKAARTCHTPVDTYSVIGQPGNFQVTVPGNVTTASFTGLTNGVDYTFTVAASNSDGNDSVGSNHVMPGPACANANLSASPAAPRVNGVRESPIPVLHPGCERKLDHQANIRRQHLELGQLPIRRRLPHDPRLGQPCDSGSQPA